MGVCRFDVYFSANHVFVKQIYFDNYSVICGFFVFLQIDFSFHSDAFDLQTQ